MILFVFLYFKKPYQFLNFKRSNHFYFETHSYSFWCRYYQVTIIHVSHVSVIQMGLYMILVSRMKNMQKEVSSLLAYNSKH